MMSRALSVAPCTYDACEGGGVGGGGGARARFVAAIIGAGAPGTNLALGGGRFGPPTEYKRVRQSTAQNDS